MNIFILNDYAVVRGGADLVPILEAKALARKGFNVTFFASGGINVSNNLKFNKLKVLSYDKGDLSDLGKKYRNGIRLLWNQDIPKLLKKICNNYSISDTIFHVHGWTKSLTSSVFPALLSFGYQPIITVHDYFLACPNGAFFDFKRLTICNRVPLSPSCICTNCDLRSYNHKIWRLTRQVLQILKGRFPRDAKYFIFPSNYSHSILKPYLPLNAKPFFIKNPIDIKRRSRTQAEKNNLYLFIGRFTQEKGVLTFAKAASFLNVKAVFVGDGYLKKEIRNICPKGIILKWQGRTGVFNIFQKARCLVFPSFWHENAPLVVGEALSFGVPVITSNLSAATEQIKNKINGFHYEGNNVSDLQNKILLSNDDATIKKMSLRAYRDYWHAPMTPERHANSLISVYKMVLKDQCKKTHS